MGPLTQFEDVASLLLTSYGGGQRWCKVKQLELQRAAASIQHQHPAQALQRHVAAALQIQRLDVFLLRSYAVSTQVPPDLLCTT